MRSVNRNSWFCRILKVMFCVSMRSPPHNYAPTTKASIWFVFDWDMTREKKRWFPFFFFFFRPNKFGNYFLTRYGRTCRVIYKEFDEMLKMRFLVLSVKHYDVNFTITHMSRKVKLFVIFVRKNKYVFTFWFVWNL